jgi:hypothetical protein
LSESEKRRGALPSLERAAANQASRLLFDRQLAEFAYALVAIDPANDQGVIWLGKALAALGDTEGMKHVFQKALAREDLREDEKEGLLRGFVRAKELAQDRPSPLYTLSSLRNRGWAGVDDAIGLARSAGSRSKCCPKCDGWGYLAWFGEHDGGRCYECNGSGVV